jgi:lipid-binding SYLF domain-containing protein
MTKKLISTAVCVALMTLVAAPRAEGQIFGQPASVDQVVVNATNVFTQSAGMSSGIPQKLLESAQGIAIVPNMVRGAFVVGLQHGRGVLLVRDAAGAWQPPQMIQITGGSLGYQIGVQSTDLILVFRTRQSVDNLMQRTIKIGVDASAAAGPVGRQASAATDLPMQAEILSYSRARGAFIGVSIDGSSISLDPEAQAALYQPSGIVPASAVQLVQTVTAYSNEVGTTAVVPPGVVPVAAPGPPSEIEVARQQLDAASRQLAAQLPDNWKQYLALPPEVYIPNFVPSAQSIQQAIARYEEVSREPQFSALTDRPEYQETLRGLWLLGELLQSARQPLSLPPPPRTSSR